MAEDLADAIVSAAKRMEKEKPLYTIATMRQASVGAKFDIHGVTPGRTLSFLHYEDAYNFMAYNGFREVQGAQAEEIKARILHGDKGARRKSRYRQPLRVVHVFQLPVDVSASADNIGLEA